MRTDADDFLAALINDGMARHQGGDVEAPTGHYAAVWVPDPATVAMMDMTLPATGLEPGRWYIVVTDSQGHQYNAQACCVHSADADIAEFEREYAAWGQDGEG